MGDLNQQPAANILGRHPGFLTVAFRSKNKAERGAEPVGAPPGQLTAHPGLGAEIDQDYFKNQFKGKPFEALKTIDVVKAPIPDVDNDHREALRQQVKALELDAERRLMLELEDLAPAPSGAPRRAIDGLVETAKLWARVVPRPALTTLADRLPA